MPKTIIQAAILPAPPDRLFDMYLDPVAHGSFTGAPVAIGSQPVHVNVADDDFAGVSQGWQDYYWTPWREYLEALEK
jgi:hypothetical protein